MGLSNRSPSRRTLSTRPMIDLHQAPYSAAGGAAVALELSAGVHSRSSCYPKREVPAPKVLPHDPGSKWRPTSTLGTTTIRLPHPTLGYVRNRGTVNAELNATGPGFDANKYSTFTPGKYHGMHVQKGALAEPLPPRTGWESLADGKMSRAPRVHMTPAQRAAENSRSLTRTVVNERNDAFEHMSIPYVREAAMTRELYNILQSLQDTTPRSEGSGGSRGPEAGSAQPKIPPSKAIARLDMLSSTQRGQSLTGTGDDVVVPAVKLRRAADLQRSVIQLVKPADVPIHGRLHHHVPRHVTEAKLRNMYMKEDGTAGGSASRSSIMTSNNELVGRRRLAYMKTSQASQREVLKSAQGNAPFYWLVSRTESA